ncbi:MAG: multiheme c-type cytochrome [Candidatus Zipacnadales bacterium]
MLLELALLVGLWPTNQTLRQSAITAKAYESPDFCKACHKELYEQWQGTMHSQASSDPFYMGTFQLASRETDGLVDQFCSRCHTPVGALAGEIPPVDHSRLSEVSAQGIFCDFCHTLEGQERIANARYIVRPGEVKLGPFGDGNAVVHKVQFSEFHTRPEFCGTCHDVDHPVNGLPLETTYREWAAGPYNTGIVETQTTCQDCHMTPGPGVMKPNPGKASELGEKRPHIWTHSMVGGGGLAALLGETALMEAARQRLQAAAEMKLYGPDEVSQGTQAEIKVAITNVGCGHHLPTGVTELRDMWLELTVTEAQGKVVFQSGHLDKNGELTPGTVKYGVIVADADGQATPKFWLAASKLSDHRIPPKETVTERFVVPVPQGITGPLTVQTRLRYRAASPSVLRLGLGEDSPATLPIVEMTEAKMELSVRD